MHILEALAAAGLRPTVYQNVRVRAQGAAWPLLGCLAPWLEARYPHQHWLSTPLLSRLDPFDFHRQHPLGRQGAAGMRLAAGSWRLAVTRPARLTIAAAAMKMPTLLLVGAGSWR